MPPDNTVPKWRSLGNGAQPTVAPFYEGFVAAGPGAHLHPLAKMAAAQAGH
jgi:hypothetical protein